MTEARFNVGDLVRVTESYANSTNVHRGDHGTITSVDTSGRYVWYDVRISSRFGTKNVRLSQSKLALVSEATPKAEVDGMTTEELARKVVKVASELAKEHDWCNVVDEALIDMGLSKYMEPTERTYKVTITVNVDGERSWDNDDYRDAVWDRIADGAYVDDVIERIS